jgi:hypothetical protein
MMFDSLDHNIEIFFKEFEMGTLVSPRAPGDLRSSRRRGRETRAERGPKHTADDADVADEKILESTFLSASSAVKAIAFGQDDPASYSQHLCRTQISA